MAPLQAATINGTLTFQGLTTGSATLMAQNTGSDLTFILPNFAPNNGQMISIANVVDNVVTLGYSTVSSEGTDITSVALAAPGIFSVSGSPITSGAGTLTLSLATQAANLVWAGPASGPVAAPTFRALVAADIPALAYLPTSTVLAANTPAVSHEFITAYNSTTGAFTQAQPAFSDISGTANLTQLSSVRGSLAGVAVQLSDSNTSATAGDVVTYTADGATHDSGVLLSGLATLASPAFTGTATAVNLTVSGTLQASGIQPPSGTQFSVSAVGVGSQIALNGLSSSQILINASGAVSVTAAAGQTVSITAGTSIELVSGVNAHSFIGVAGNIDLSGAHGHIVQNSDVAGTITVNTGAASGSYTILGTYASAPVVVASPTSDPAAAGATSWWVSSTTSAITIHVAGTTTSPLVFNYIAMGN